MPTNNRPNKQTDYQIKKAYFDNLLTIYGRNAVLEALQMGLKVRCLHLADSNKPAAILKQIEALALKSQVPIKIHEKRALSRISKNGKQDQGIAADIYCPLYQSVESYFSASSNVTNSQKTEPQRLPSEPQRFIALDRINNPQNLGMIIRSICAGEITGLILPKDGSAQISPLVIKASAGTAFKTRILRCDKLSDSLELFKSEGFKIYALCTTAKHSLFEQIEEGPCVYVLGNESDGLSPTVAKISDNQFFIPMNNDVESLNLAVTAGLIAFLKPIQRTKS